MNWESIIDVIAERASHLAMSRPNGSFRRAIVQELLLNWWELFCREYLARASRELECIDKLPGCGIELGDLRSCMWSRVKDDTLEKN